LTRRAAVRYNWGVRRLLGTLDRTLDGAARGTAARELASDRHHVPAASRGP
jgi:hypothetical protein